MDREEMFALLAQAATPNQAERLDMMADALTALDADPEAQAHLATMSFTRQIVAHARDLVAISQLPTTEVDPDDGYPHTN